MSQQRAERLAAMITELAQVYHQGDKPLVDDETYNAMVRELRALYAEGFVVNPDPLQTVGATPLKDFETVSHLAPMLSLDNTFNSTELHERLLSIREKANNCMFVAEYKLDGLALSVIYKYGKLAYAATRGDGAVGEIVTSNVKMIKSVPHELDALRELPCVEVRGEVFIRQKDFDAFNATIEQSKRYANPRNLAAGSLRLHDANESAKRPLSFAAYDMLVHQGELVLETQQQKLEILDLCGFETAMVFCGDDIDRLIQVYQEIEKRRDADEIKIPIDGVVIKVNDVNTYRSLGGTATVPHGAFAAKFQPKSAITQLISVSWRTGRTGVLTPLAYLDAVHLGGARIQRCTLHNYQEIQRLNLSIGCHVVVERRGDVIPKITGVAYQTGAVRAIEEPTRCTHCGAAVVRNVSYGADKTKPTIEFICPAKASCYQQRASYIEYLFSKDVLDVEGIGEIFAQELAEVNGFNLDLEGLFKPALWVPLLKQRKTLAGANIDKVAMSIENLKEIKLYRLILALGVYGVGEVTAKVIAKHFSKEPNAYKGLPFIDASELKTLAGIGDITANAIVKWFANEHNASFFEFLTDRFSVIPEIIVASNASAYAGQTWVITGTFNLSREELKQKLEAMGITVSSSVSAKTNAVLAGANAGSKLQKAKELNIPVFHELPITE